MASNGDRWVVKRDGVYLCGLGSANGRPAWSGDQRYALVYGSRGFAANDVERHGGRVVKLVAKRVGWKDRAEKAEAEVERLREELAKMTASKHRCWRGWGESMLHARRWKALAKRLRTSDRSLAAQVQYEKDRHGSLVERNDALRADLARLRGPAPTDEEIRNAWASSDEYRMLAHSRKGHARRWKAVAKRVRRERDAFRGNLDAVLGDCATLQGQLSAIRAVLRAAGRYVEPAHEGRLGIAANLKCEAPAKGVSLNPAPVDDLPLRRREVSDEELGEAVWTKFCRLGTKYLDLLEEDRADCVEAGRAAVALATRPAITREEFLAAAEAFHRSLGDKLVAFVGALGLEVES